MISIAVSTCLLFSQLSSASLWIYSVHSHEELRILSLRPDRVDEVIWRKANRFWRSRRTKMRRTVHPRLLRKLSHIQTHFGGIRLELISGYRTPAAGDKLSSYHQVGRAADIRIPGVPKRVLFEYCRTLDRTGCGFYPNSEFVHVDVRGQSAIWVDLSPPGQPRRYVAGAANWLRTHR